MKYQNTVQLTPRKTTVSKVVALIHSIICHDARKRNGVSNILLDSPGSAISPIVLHGVNLSTSEYKLMTATHPMNYIKYHMAASIPYISMFLLTIIVSHFGFK